MRKSSGATCWPLQNVLISAAPDARGRLVWSAPVLEATDYCGIPPGPGGSCMCKSRVQGGTEEQIVAIARESEREDLTVPQVA